MNSIRTLLQIAVALFLTYCAAAAEKPNIVLFFVDDLGWADLGYRQPDIFETPHIDQLASEGVDFQQAYVACPTCSPSRATLLTGKHPARLQMVRHIPANPENGFDAFGRSSMPFNMLERDPAQFPSRNWLPSSETTYAEALAKQGYYNEFIGKWHLGSEEYHPTEQGFSKQYGTSNSGHPRSYYPPFFKNSEVLAEVEDEHLTDTLTKAAVSFIQSYEKPQPFMLSMWYYGVHGPHTGHKRYNKHFLEKGLEPRYAKYAAMVKAIDDSIGQIRASLDAKRIAENTVVIFLSDQGGYFENPPLRGGKMKETLFEGGARVPFIIHHPGVRNASKNDSVVQSTDLFPTLLEIAGENLDAYDDFDGVSLFPILSGKQSLNRLEPIYGYRAYENLYATVRDGDWKLIAYRDGPLKLFNIAKDISETTNLAADQPERTADLAAKLAAWEKKMGVEKYSGLR